MRQIYKRVHFLFQLNLYFSENFSFGKIYLRALHSFFRSSCPGVFCKKGALKNLANFTGKNLCQSLFFNKVAGVTSAALFKKKLCQRCFPVNSAKFWRIPSFIEHFQWLLLIFRAPLNLDYAHGSLNWLCSLAIYWFSFLFKL